MSTEVVVRVARPTIAAIWASPLRWSIFQTIKLSMQNEKTPIDNKFWAFNVLGSIVTAISVASLIQRVFNVGISPSLEIILISYRSFVRPIHDLFQYILFSLPIPITIPPILSNLTIFAIVCSLSSARGSTLHMTATFLVKEEFDATSKSLFTVLHFLEHAAKTLITFRWVLELANSPKYTIAYVLNGARYVTEYGQRDLYSSLSIFTGLLGALIFFCLNVYIS